MALILNKEDLIGTSETIKTAVSEATNSSSNDTSILSLVKELREFLKIPVVQDLIRKRMNLNSPENKASVDKQLAEYYSQHNVPNVDLSKEEKPAEATKSEDELRKEAEKTYNKIITTLENIRDNLSPDITVSEMLKNAKEYKEMLILAIMKDEQNK